MYRGFNISSVINIYMYVCMYNVFNGYNDSRRNFLCTKRCPSMSGQGCSYFQSYGIQMGTQNSMFQELFLVSFPIDNENRHYRIITSSSLKLTKRKTNTGEARTLVDRSDYPKCNSFVLSHFDYFFPIKPKRRHFIIYDGKSYVWIPLSPIMYILILDQSMKTPDRLFFKTVMLLLSSSCFDKSMVCTFEWTVTFKLFGPLLV